MHRGGRCENVFHRDQGGHALGLGHCREGFKRIGLIQCKAACLGTAERGHRAANTEGGTDIGAQSADICAL